MKKYLSYLLPTILLLGIGVAIAFTLIKNKSIVEERVYHFDPAKANTPTFTEEAVLAETEKDGLSFTGTFEPTRESKISAEMQGRIANFSVNEGDVVTKGQVLVKLDDALLHWQLKAVNVQIEGLIADVHRYTILSKADAVQGIQLEKAELGLKSARVQHNTILEQIKKTTIRAPFKGVVHMKMSEVGGFAAPGVPLVHLIEMDPMKFVIQVPENDLKYFKIGDSHNIAADAFPDKKVTGIVRYIASKANVGHLFAVQFTVPNFKDHSLRAGMFGKLTLSH